MVILLPTLSLIVVTYITLKAVRVESDPKLPAPERQKLRDVHHRAL
jgi:hypothetical protein